MAFCYLSLYLLSFLALNQYSGNLIINNQPKAMSDTFLSPSELSVFMDKSYMPLKFIVLSKMETLLNELRQQIIDEIKPVAQTFPPDFDVKTGKISRGENYKTYPYRVLDMPSAFKKKNIFTYRTVVLWGHHISFHLIVAGKYKEMLQDRLFAVAPAMPEALCLSKQASPWEWEFNPEEFIQARALQEDHVQEAVRQSDFIKITFILPLNRYQELAHVGLQVWKFWQALVAGK